MAETLSLSHIQTARKRIAPCIRRTPFDAERHAERASEIERLREAGAVPENRFIQSARRVQQDSEPQAGGARARYCRRKRRQSCAGRGVCRARAGAAGAGADAGVDAAQLCRGYARLRRGSEIRSHRCGRLRRSGGVSSARAGPTCIRSTIFWSWRGKAPWDWKFWKTSRR